jgi:hypothetical protein
LRDFEDEVEQEERHFLDVAAEDVEEIPELLGGDVYEVVLLGLPGLYSDEVLPLLVVVLAQQLQELEGPPIGGDAQLVIEVLVSGVGLENVLTQRVSLAHIVVVVVVYSVGGELASSLLLAHVGLDDVLLDEHAELLNQRLDVLEDLVLGVLVELLDDVLLGEGVAAEEVGDGAEEDGVGEFDVVDDVLLEQRHNELAQLAVLQALLRLLDLLLVAAPVLRLPLVDVLLELASLPALLLALHCWLRWLLLDLRLRLLLGLVRGLHQSSDELQEEDLAFGGECG